MNHASLLCIIDESMKRYKKPRQEVHAFSVILRSFNGDVLINLKVIEEL